MLTLSPSAVEAVDVLLQNPGVPEDAGLRIAATSDSALELGIAAEPEPDDQVIEEGDARVFVDAVAVPLLDDARLEAQAQGDGITFSLTPQGGPSAGQPSFNGNGPTAA